MCDRELGLLLTVMKISAGKKIAAGINPAAAYE
jgi:hypothetical protein